MSKMKMFFVFLAIYTLTSTSIQAQAIKSESPLLRGAYRSEQDGWIYAHLEGTPFQVGYQNGYLLWDNIDVAYKANIHIWWSDEEYGDLWYQARDISRLYIWPKVTPDIKAEIEGIAAGVRARGLNWDKWDILAFNAWGDISVYWDIYMNDHGHPGGGNVPLPRLRNQDAGCSAFVATGTYTTDGKIVMGHNTWSGYADWGYCQVMVDITPNKGHRVVFQSFGGSVWSGPDWIYNDVGLMVTETTLPDMYVYDPNGTPVFVRERYALQYGSSIDDFIEVMTYKNNGAYANDWLVGDAKTGEICSLELGCYKWDIIRSSDGFITSCNYPRGTNVRSETTYDWTDTTTSGYCRNQRWTQIYNYYTTNKGLIDCEVGKGFESDHVNTYAGETGATLRTLCGHGETETGPPYAFGDAWPDGGATDAKVTCSDLVLNHLGMWARWGHPCGTQFLVAPFLTAHPDYAWELPYLRDLPYGGSVPWTLFDLK